MTSNPIFPFDPELLNRLLGLSDDASPSGDLPEADARAAFAARQASLEAAMESFRSSAEAGKSAFARLLTAAEAALAGLDQPATGLDDLAGQIKSANNQAWNEAIDAVLRSSGNEPRT